MLRLPPERVDQSGEEAAFACPRDAVTALSAPQPGIEQVSDIMVRVIRMVSAAMAVPRITLGMRNITRFPSGSWTRGIYFIDGAQPHQIAG